MRALAIIVLILVSAFAVFALAFPDQFRAMSMDDTARLAWLLAAGVLVGAGAFGFRGGPRVGLGRALLYAAIWGGVIIGLVLLYHVFRDVQSGGRVTT